MLKKTFNTTFTSSNTTNAYSYDAIFSPHCICNKEAFIPTRVIYNPPYTICTFPDGTKVKVRCTEDEVMFNKEIGVMACIVKKIMERNRFKRIVNSGYVQPSKSAWE